METRWTKVRLWGERVPFYATETDSDPVTRLTGNPIAEITAASPTSGRIPAILSDGRRGFLLADVDCVSMALWTTVDSKTRIYLEAGAWSPVVAELGSGALIEQFGLTVKNGDESWIPVQLSDGQHGYVGSKVKIVNHGRQVRIRKSPDDPGRLWLLKDGKLRPFEQRLKSPREAAQRDMAVGALLCLAGIVVTVVTFSAAVGSGGVYLIMWGPVVYGGFRFIRGLVRLTTS
jgi:hypothetical protein